jgi:hypothetical protein
MSLRVRNPVVPLLVSVTVLLAISVVLQTVIVSKMSQWSSQIAPTRSGRQQPIPVEIKNTDDIDVNVRNHSIPVEIKNSSVPVEITNAGDIDVNVRDHYIIRGDPIPVEIVR